MKNIINGIYIIIFEIILILFVTSMRLLNIIPTKYLVFIYIFIFSFSLLSIYFIRIKSITYNIVGYIVSVFIMALLSLASFYIFNTYKFIDNTNNKKADIYTYNVIVLKKNKIDDISKITSIGYLDDNNKESIKNELEEKSEYEEKLFNESGEMLDSFENSTIQAICVNSSYLDTLYEEIDDFKDKSKVIYTFKISKEKETEKEEKQENTFVLYISGIDQYGNVNSVTGRSDVNMLAIVNTSTHKILLVNTPRDYYVQLHGTTGLKDKLTHAGIYGINKSVETLEDLYGIDIKYYVRVNFDTLVKVVDVIDGVEVYSDTNFGIIKKGWNHLNGEKALIYSRERYSYTSGDRHRGQNQQQVITSIINKVTSNYVLLSKYNELLKTLDGTFQTNMTTTEITSYIKKQLSTMSEWNVESISVDGKDAYRYTYSMGKKRKLYVMIPDDNTIKSAKEKISEYLEN